MANNLTAKEKEFTNKLIQSSQKSVYSFLFSALFGVISVTGIYLGFRFNSKDGFMLALYFGTLAAILILKTIYERRIVLIIKKLTSDIEL